MYSIFDFEEEKRFKAETETVISMQGQAAGLLKTIHYFDSVVKDLKDKTLTFEAYTGAYTVDLNELVIKKISPVEGISTTIESGGLQVIASATTLHRFLALARANYCKRLVVYTNDSIMVETLFANKFHMCQLNQQGYEVRAELDL